MRVFRELCLYHEQNTDAAWKVSQLNTKALWCFSQIKTDYAWLAVNRRTSWSSGRSGLHDIESEGQGSAAFSRLIFGHY